MTLATSPAKPLPSSKNASVISRAPRSARRPAAAPSRGGSSLDDLVGAGEDRRRHDNADRLGGGEIDRQSKLCRAFDRQLTRLRPVNCPVHILHRAPEDRAHIGPEREQA